MAHNSVRLRTQASSCSLIQLNEEVEMSDMNEVVLTSLA